MTTAAVSSLTIRRAEPRDAALLAALFCDAAMLPFTLIPPYSSAAHWDKRLGEYADAACLPLVAFAGEALVGVLLLRAFPIICGASMPACSTCLRCDRIIGVAGWSCTAQCRYPRC